jgi:hypothetical protein
MVRQTTRWQDGDPTKSDPFFILILNNIALERPVGSGIYIGDLDGSAPGGAHEAAFTQQAGYIVDNLLGRLAGQAEQLLADSPHAANIRIWSTFVSGALADQSTCLVLEDPTKGSTIIEPRRDEVVQMLRRLELNPDIVFIITQSTTHDRASAYGTTDDDARGGRAFQYDGAPFFHRWFHEIPGMAAIHMTSSAMTAAHEFGHAFSSYTNGFIDDLYVDGTSTAFNRKYRAPPAPVPQDFATYDGTVYDSDLVRDGLGYPANWSSYHAELADPANPALMDNFWMASGGNVSSRHDKLTKQFVLDRIDAKATR